MGLGCPSCGTLLTNQHALGCKWRKMEMDDIKVIRGEEVTAGGHRNVGVFAWRVPSLGLSGFSRQPLLDACLAIKSLLGDTPKCAAMFREGRADWDKRCSVEWGATRRVYDDSRGWGFERRKSAEEIAALFGVAAE